jgi:hypothetical protein
MLADSTSAAHCNGWDFDTPVRKEPRDVLAPEVMSPHGPVSTVRCDAVICPELGPDRTHRRHGQSDAIDPHLVIGCRDSPKGFDIRSNWFRVGERPLVRGRG